MVGQRVAGVANNWSEAVGSILGGVPFLLVLMLILVGNLGYHLGDTGDGPPGTEGKGERNDN